MQRLDKFGELISDLKMEHSNLKAEMTDIKRENVELVETVNKMKSGHFKYYNKIDELNSDFKTEDFKLSLELDDLRKVIDYVRRENHELKNTVNEIKVLMESGQFSDNNKADARIKTERKPLPIQVAKMVKKRIVFDQPRE